jgi:hypothetical protein
MAVSAAVSDAETVVAGAVGEASRVVAAAAAVVAAAAGDVWPPGRTWLAFLAIDSPFAVAKTASAVEVMVTGNSVIWSQPMVEVLVPGVSGPFPVTVSVQV